MLVILVQNKIFKNDVMTLCLQIELREREIERLSIALDGGRSSDILSLETKNKTNEKIIAHLNIQVMAFIIILLNVWTPVYNGPQVCKSDSIVYWSIIYNGKFLIGPEYSDIGGSYWKIIFVKHI